MPSAAADDDRDDDPIVARGLAAMLRRHPQRVRKAAAGTVVGGLLLFSVASVAFPAGAHTDHKKAERAGAAPALQAPDLDAVFPAHRPPAVAGANSVLATKPRHVAKKAPATKAVISGLAANGIPNVALNAYRVAAARMAHAEPGCGIDWALLAGIGREESDHGRFAGAILNADGTSTPPIIGIPLNGNGTALITDTDHGGVDGDTVYDRAAGPMQFIPSTWAAYGTDATGDGVADIFNINDAALSAARYLCAAGGNLRTPAGQSAAVLAYNHSDQYLAQVLALANAYRTGTPVSGIPVGNIDGALPPVSSTTGYLPPVNPGPPTAVSKTTAKTTVAQKPPATTKPAAPAPGASVRPTSGSTPTTTSGAAPTGTATSTTPPLLPLPSTTLKSTPPKTSTTPAPSPTCRVPLGDICLIP